MHGESSDNHTSHQQDNMSFQLLTEVGTREGTPLLKRGRNTITYSVDVNDYEIRAVVGQGCCGGAVISAAIHNPNGLLVAIRRTNLEDRNVNLKEIQHEVLLTRQLSHKNLLPYYCSFISDGYIFAVMPYMAYGSARDLLNYPFQRGMPELVVAHILHDVLQALEYLHRRGIIHRGIKSSHILISTKGQVCLTGLRYSCDLMRSGKLLKTMHCFEPNVIRNLNWLSPEVLEQNLLGYNTKSDIYSVGITACEMANGAVPFAHMPPTQMLLEKLRGPTPLLLDASTWHVIETAEQQSGDIEGIPNYFKHRLYTEGFHQFVVCCLQRDAVLRPTVSQLLQHVLFKQCRRSNSSLFDLLHSLVPTAENVDCNQINTKTNCTLAVDIDDKLGSVVVNDDSWDF